MLQGDVASRPWGATLGALAGQRATGELVLIADDGKRYTISFENGMIVGATSPLAADSALRVAMTGHLVSSTQVGMLNKLIAGSPTRDEIDVIAETCRLSPEHIDRLRRRAITQRAARTFSIDTGTYTFTTQVATGPHPYAIDVGAAILLGARMNLSEVRLVDDLRQLGARFTLRIEFDRAQLGLTETEEPILEDLRRGTTLAELDARHRDIEPRVVQATVYALVAIGACDGIGGRPATRQIGMPRSVSAELTVPRTISADLATPRTMTPSGSSPAMPRTTTPAIPRTTTATPPALPRTTSSPSLPRTTTPPAVSRTTSGARTTTVDVERVPTRDFVRPTNDDSNGAFEVAKQRTITSEPLPPSAMPRTRSSPSIPRPTTPRQLAQVRETIAWGVELLDKGADHFALFGLTKAATLDSIRSAYVAFVNQLHPDKIPPLDEPELQAARRLFAHINVAFGVLSDPLRRAEYAASLRPEPQVAAAAKPEMPDSPSERTRLAAEAHKRGLAALRRDDTVAALDELGKAVMLMPADVDHHAALAWIRFCASSDRQKIAPETRKALERAVHRSPKPSVARFYLGRVERMLGRIEQALEHFHEVIQLEPNHAEAATEIRLLTPRSAKR